jgi:glycosyltransferase involved in cell wall biosynthesis
MQRYENSVKIRVLYLMNHAGQGGTERYVETLIDRLGGSKIIPYFAWNEEGPLLGRLKSRDIPVFHIVMKHRFDMRAAKQLAALCRENHIDIVHTQFLREHYISFLSKIFKNKAALVASAHLMLDSPAKPPILWLDKMVYRAFSAVIAVCRRLMVQIKQAYGLTDNHLFTIHNGIDLEIAAEREKSADVSRLETRESLGLSRQDVVFITVGRFSEEKGLVFLLESIREWRNIFITEECSVRFLIVGDGPQMSEIRDLCVSLDLQEVVVFAGYRKDVAALLTASDVYISPSRTEALSLSILEAMACGLPIIATDVGGTQEMVNAEFENGQLVAYNDRKDLARKIDLFHNNEDLRLQVGSKAKDVVKTFFPLEKTVEETYTLYENITEQVS